MSRLPRLVPVLAVALALAACSGTGSDSPLAPSAPRYDDGGTTMGGNFAGDTGSPTTDPMPADTTSRGGTLMGGN